MFRRRWLPVLLGGLVSAAAVQAQPIAGDGNRQHNIAQRQAQKATNPQPTIPPVVQADIDRIAHALEAANSHPNADAEEQRAKDNLKAQQDTAKWAGWMLVIATVEVSVTFFGVVLVAFTLSAARRSAIAAEKTLEETRRAANATVGAERDRIRSNYIFLNDAEHRPNPSGIDLLQLDHITVGFRNGGKSAASVVGICVNRVVVEQLPDVPVYGEVRPSLPSENIIEANATWQYTSWGQDRADDGIDPDLANAILYGDNLYYWVYGYIDILNFVGDRERKKFCGCLDGNALAMNNLASHLRLGGPKAYTED